jgi:hypothetical protein
MSSISITCRNGPRLKFPFSLGFSLGQFPKIFSWRRRGVAGLASYSPDIPEHSAVFVRGVRMPTAEGVATKTGEIRATGEALSQLADEPRSTM